jgi:hypothetical protein
MVLGGAEDAWRTQPQESDILSTEQTLVVANL